MNDLFHHSTIEQIRNLVADLEALKNIVVPQANLLLQMALSTEIDTANMYLSQAETVEDAGNHHSERRSLSREQAIIALERGYSITHALFTVDEFIKLDSDPDFYRDEKSLLFTKTEFWMHRIEHWFDNGWRIIVTN